LVKPTKIFEAEISARNQQRNFLAVFSPEHTVALEKFMSDFKLLYDLEIIEWE